MRPPFRGRIPPSRYVATPACRRLALCRDGRGRNHCGFTALYNCARELQAQTFADELIDIAPLTHPVATRARDTWPRAADRGAARSFSSVITTMYVIPVATPRGALYISVTTFKFSKASLGCT